MLQEASSRWDGMENIRWQGQICGAGRDRMWGEEAGATWISSHLPTKNTVYLHLCSGKRWSEDSNLILDFKYYYYFEPWLLCLVEVPCLDGWAASQCFHHLESTWRGSTVPVWVLHTAEEQGEHWGNAVLARNVAAVLLENTTEERLNTHKTGVNLAESLIQ